MLAVKTAISIDKNLFDQAENIARRMNVSRSRLFGLALQEFIEHQSNREMLAKINAVFSDEPDETDNILQQKTRRQHRRIVKRDEW